jgi:hypothetical protein
MKTSNKRHNADEGLAEFRFQSKAFNSIYLWEAFRNKQITGAEFLLIAIIDSLSDPHSNRGCFASNAYLARSTHTDERIARRTIQRLKAKGYLVTHTDEDGQRFLICCRPLIQGQNDPPRGDQSDPSPPDQYYPPECIPTEYTYKSKGMPAQPGAATGVPTTTSKPVNNPRQRSATTQPDNLVPRPTATRSNTKPRSKGGKVFALNQTTSQYDKPTKPSFRVSAQDKERMALLRSYCKERGYPSSRAAKRGADALRILRESGAQDVDEVLAWLMATKPNKPRISDGADFRRCFNWLHDLWLRSRDRQSVQLDVSNEAQLITNRIRSYGWPSQHTAEELSQAVQHSLNNLRAFLTACRDVTKRYKNERGVKASLGHFARVLSNGWLCSAGNEGQYVTNWYADLAGWLRQTKTFRGSLIKLGISLDNQQFTQRLARFAAEYDGGRTQLWDELLKEIKENKDG